MIERVEQSQESVEPRKVERAGRSLHRSESVPSRPEPHSGDRVDMGEGRAVALAVRRIDELAASLAEVGERLSVSRPPMEREPLPGPRRAPPPQARRGDDAVERLREVAEEIQRRSHELAAAIRQQPEPRSTVPRETTSIGIAGVVGANMVVLRLEDISIPTLGQAFVVDTGSTMDEGRLDRTGHAVEEARAGLAALRSALGEDGRGSSEPQDYTAQLTAGSQAALQSRKAEREISANEATVRAALEGGR